MPASAAYSVEIKNNTSTDFKLYHYGIDNGKTHQHPSPVLKAGATEWLSWNTVKPDDRMSPSSGHAYWVANGQAVFALQMNGYNQGNYPFTSYQYSVPVGTGDGPYNWIRSDKGWGETYGFCFTGEGGKHYHVIVANDPQEGRLYTVTATIEDFKGFW